MLDLALAAGDGYGVVEELRRDPALAATPVLVYTVSDLNAHERRRLVLGPTEFLTKSNAHVASIEEKVLTLVGRSPDKDVARRVLMVDDDPHIQDVAVPALERISKPFDPMTLAAELSHLMRWG